MFNLILVCGGLLGRVGVDWIRLPILPRVRQLCGVEVDVGKVFDHGLVEANAVALEKFFGQLVGAVVDEALHDAPGHNV